VPHPRRTTQQNSIDDGPNTTPPNPNFAGPPLGLTPRPLPQAKPAEQLAVGEAVKTGPAERRRLLLPDNSVLYVDRNTAVRLDEDRRVVLDAGSVYVETETLANLPPGGATFFVKTPTREVSTSGTRFAVQSGDAGTDVLVTQGEVQVSDVEEPV